jgi:cell division protein FtsW
MKLKPYRMERFKVFLDSGIDPQDIGYQINQALLAIGSGGILGLGLGHSRQKFNYLPEPVGDSIFAIIAEELGFIGAVFLLSLFVFFALRSLRLAGLAPDKFSRMLVVGIVSWITFQAFVNIMGITKLIPLTGITLPFISYGSTSLVTVLMASGILLNISKYSKKTNKK